MRRPELQTSELDSTSSKKSQQKIYTSVVTSPENRKSSHSLSTSEDLDNTTPAATDHLNFYRLQNDGEKIRKS